MYPALRGRTSNSSIVLQIVGVSNCVSRLRSMGILVIVEPPASTDEKSWSPTSATSARILVAEDSAVIRTVLRGMLTRWGYEVVVAGGWGGGMGGAPGPGAPRLAIVDWMMPRMKGPELCRLLRAGRTARHPTCLMLTARSRSRRYCRGIRRRGR